MEIFMELCDISTSDLISEIISRDGVDWSEVTAGLEYNYKPPKDGHFIIVPKNAMPHRETAKEKEAAIRVQFMAELLKNYREGKTEAGNMLAILMKG